MNKTLVELKKALSGVVLIAATTAASGAGAMTSVPEFHFMNQTLSSSSLFFPDVDIFGLGGLEDLAATAYTASFESVSGTALGLFAVFAVDTPFTMPEGLGELGGAFFGASVVDPKFNFTSTPGKYHYIVVSGLGDSMPEAEGLDLDDSMPASYNLHVTAVPEAETWAMMLVGLGLVGSMVYRRRISSAVSV